MIQVGRCRDGMLSATVAFQILFAGLAAPAFAEKAILVGPQQVRVEFEGLSSETGALNLSLVKMGALEGASSRSFADGSVCPAGERLAPTGLTIVCQDPDGALAVWYKKVLSGETGRKSGSIIYLDREGKEVLRQYNLYDCFPKAYRKYEPDDCDDTNDDRVVLELTVGGVALSPRQRVSLSSAERGTKHNGDYLPAHNFKIEIDGCVTGGTCPGTASDSAHGVSLSTDVASALPGPVDAWLNSAGRCSVSLDTSNDCDDLWSLILLSQSKPVTLPSMKCTINTSRSNIKNQKTAGPSATLDLGESRLRQVILPTFQVTPKAPETDVPAVVEELEFVVEKVERG